MIKRKFYSLVSLVVAVLTIFSSSPAYAYPYGTPQSFADMMYQDTSGDIDHYVFYKHYLYGPFDLADQVGTYWAGDYLYGSYLSTAMSQYNSAMPSDVGDWTTATEANADLKLYSAFSSCGSAPVCLSWTSEEVIFGVHTMKKGVMYIHTTPASGYTWSTGGLQAATSSLVGSVHGLGSQMPNSSTACNASISSIMEGLTFNSGTHQVTGCGVTSPQTQDTNNMATYYRGLNYTYKSIASTPSNVTAQWYDTVWMDWNLQAYWQYASSSSGPWTDFYATTKEGLGNPSGSNKSVLDGMSISAFAYTVSVNPGLFSVPSGRYIRSCVRPHFTGSSSGGSNVCSPSVIYFP